jgi:hypothetical protein
MAIGPTQEASRKIFSGRISRSSPWDFSKNKNDAPEWRNAEWCAKDFPEPLLPSPGPG